MYIPAKAKAQMREVALAYITTLSHATAERRTASSVGSVEMWVLLHCVCIFMVPANVWQTPSLAMHQLHGQLVLMLCWQCLCLYASMHVKVQASMYQVYL